MYASGFVWTEVDPLAERGSVETASAARSWPEFRLPARASQDHRRLALARTSGGAEPIHLAATRGLGSNLSLLTASCDDIVMTPASPVQVTRRSPGP